MHAAQPQGDRGTQPPARFGNFSAVKSSPPAAGKDRRYAAVTQLLEVCDGNRLLHRKGIVNPSIMACAMTAPLTQGSPACRKSIFAPLSQFLQLWKSCKNALIERAVGFLPPAHALLQKLSSSFFDSLSSSRRHRAGGCFTSAAGSLGIFPQRRGIGWGGEGCPWARHQPSRKMWDC